MNFKYFTPVVTTVSTSEPDKNFTSTGDNSSSIISAITLHTVVIIHPYLMPFLTRSGFSAPTFCETKVVIDSPTVVIGNVENAIIFLAAVCPAIMCFPSLLIDDCKITVPIDTIEDINPIASPCAQSSPESLPSYLKSFLPGRYSLYFLKRYIIHKTADVNSAITVATAAPRIPIFATAIKI